MDAQTSKRERLAYAGVCVEVNVKKELPNSIRIELKDESVKEECVEYDSRPTVCKTCHAFGHLEQRCLTKPTWVEKDQAPKENPDLAVVGKESRNVIEQVDLVNGCSVNITESAGGRDTKEKGDVGLSKRKGKEKMNECGNNGVCKNVEPTGSDTSSDNGKGGELDKCCASGMTQLDLVSPNPFAVLEDPEQEEAKMLDLDTAEPKEIAQDKCLGNKTEEGVVKEITIEESDLAHRSEDLEERVDTGSTMAVTEGDLFCDKKMDSKEELQGSQS